MKAIEQDFGALSTRFQGQKIEDDLGAGIQGGFGLIGYKGKVWSIRKGGEEKPLMREDGDGPRNSIEIVILKAPGCVSKIFYESGYVEGSTAAPDCYSTNGVTPASGATKKQASACGICPKNAWGSRITPAGKQGKACSDSKRLAVVPLNDIKNEALGGPMLLRVPAASLADLKNYGGFMSQRGYPYYAVGTRIAFDAAEAYPKFAFSAIRPLSDGEADAVMHMRDGADVSRILAEDDYGEVKTAQIAGPTQQEEKPLFEQQNKTKVTTGEVSSPPAQAVAPTGQQTGQAAPGPQKTAPAIAASKSAGTAGVAPPTNQEATTQATGVDDFDTQLDALLG
jgi:hypothetical protein